MLRGMFKQKSKEDNFWDWFSLNADAYFHFEKDQNNLFAQLKTQLSKINSDLVFEFSPIFSDGTREFVISADGIKSVFPIVNNLVAKAPELKSWKIIAFRQPRKNITQIKYQNLLINLDDIFFKYGKDNGQIALELNIRGFYESPEWTAATFILLDNVLGEYHTEMSLSSIDKKGLNEAEDNDLFPIRSLLKVIQDYQLELNN
jgi:hypothetical protein